jgi:hypothetical protein
MDIRVRYTSIDRCSKSRRFKTLKGARATELFPVPQSV